MRVAVQKRLLFLAFLVLLVSASAAAEVGASDVDGDAARPGAGVRWWFKKTIAVVKSKKKKNPLGPVVANRRWFKKKSIEDQVIKDSEKTNLFRRVTFGRRDQNDTINEKENTKNKTHPLRRFASGLKYGVDRERTKLFQTAKRAAKITKASADKKNGRLSEGTQDAKPAPPRHQTKFYEGMSIIIPIGLVLYLITVFMRTYIIVSSEEESPILMRDNETTKATSSLPSSKSDRSTDTTSLTVSESIDEDNSIDDSGGAPRTTERTKVPVTPPPSSIISRIGIEVDPAGLEARILSVGGEVSPLAKQENKVENADGDEYCVQAAPLEMDCSFIPTNEVGLQATYEDTPAVPGKEATYSDSDNDEDTECDSEEDFDSEEESDSEEDFDSDDDDDEETLALIAKLEAEANARTREAEEAIGKAESAVGAIDEFADGNESARELRMSLRRSSSMLWGSAVE
mmetsp:Transcript_54936/g.164530  ORF Transcript_54936/g.164530 Transcript_54936/m.164530 type:complete len:458 (-) Transcript_54936:2057-3430(-)